FNILEPIVQKVTTPVSTPAQPPFPDMIWVPGGTFRMGSDAHYPEEQPVHRVTVDGFWMDRFPVTNDRFQKFVEATGHKTFGEMPRRADVSPVVFREMFWVAALFFLKPPQRVDLRDIGSWWQFLRGADWRHPRGPMSSIQGLEKHPVVHVTFSD